MRNIVCAYNDFDNVRDNYFNIKMGMQMNMIQVAVDTASKAMQMTRSDYHITLGDLISTLKTVNSNKLIVFHEGGHPCSPHSYRGYYCDLSFESTSERTTVKDFLQLLENTCLDQEFTGYKGGEYNMAQNTPLWFADYGSTGKAIVSCEDEGDYFVLHTKEMP